jgi:glutamate/tyrosine decarboxylase-like PLP-dependent enzyme
MAAAQVDDVDWRAGKLQGYVYAVGDDVSAVAERAYRDFFATNALSPRVFPSVKRFEDELVAMASTLLHNQVAAGVVTTGGTESNLLAVLTARERAQRARPGLGVPEIVMPHSAHPSFNKAAHLFGMRATRVPTGVDLRADPAAMRAAVTDDTVLIVGSAPSYAHGVVDPIPELAAIAAERCLAMHVDACVGGFFLPFVEQLGRDVPLWDFRVSGVTSISADLHKHGYTAKGASTLLHRDPAARELHTFDFDDWPSGRYLTATIGGTRAGAAIAAAWAVLRYLGEDGYRRIVGETMRVTDQLIEGINETPGLEVWGAPVMNKFGYGSRDLDIGAVADGMEARGWMVGRQKEPPGINMHVFPVHGPIADTYLRDLSDVARLVARGELESSGKQASYN